MKVGAQNQITFKCLVLSCTARTTNFWRFLKQIKKFPYRYSDLEGLTSIDVRENLS